MRIFSWPLTALVAGALIGCDTGAGTSQMPSNPPPIPTDTSGKPVPPPTAASSGKPAAPSTAAPAKP